MPVNSAFHIAVLPGDGIGPEIMPPCIELLERLTRHIGGVSLRFEILEAAQGVRDQLGLVAVEAR